MNYDDGRLQLEIDRIKAAINLATIINGSLPLQHSGREHVSCCPFHAEKTPSFHVYRDHYHCYACGEHGDVFDWLRTQHGMGLHDAIRHLGGGNGPDLTPSAEAAALRARRKADLDAKVEADRRAQIADARRWWRDTRPVASTVAEQYLAETRGIPRPDGGWPDCVRFLPRNGGTAIESVVAVGALIVAATTADGKLCAIQRIYLDQGAQNIRRQDEKRSKVKLTSGTFLDGAGVVRLPGPSDGPLLIVEGPETGLSVWSATGFETWITVGSMAKVVLPPGRRICICRDDDRPHSAADRAIAKAIGLWLTAKLDIVVATPWPERRGEGDFNDVLRDHGPEAVRARIDAALNPGPPPPTRTSVAEGRRTVRKAMLRFAAEVQAQNESNAPPTHLVKVDVGVGKSWQARIHVAVQTLVEMRAKNDKRNVAIAVPTHSLGNEQARLIEALPEFKAAGLTARIWRGRDADNPDIPGQKMCQNKELVDNIQALKLDVKKRACAICPFREDCAYLNQEKMRGDLWLFAHQMLSEQKPGAIGKVALLIVDENPTATFLKGHDKEITLPLNVLERVDRTSSSINTERLAFLRRRTLDIINGLPDGPLPRDAFFSTNGFAEINAKEAYGLEWQTLIDVELTPLMTKVPRRKLWVVEGMLVGSTSPDGTANCALATRIAVKSCACGAPLRGCGT